MTRLSVNVNKIAVLRNSRGGAQPDVVAAARACLAAGAHGITVHPRPDARHITEADVHALADLTRAHNVELNIEGNPFAPPRRGYPGLAALCAQARPAQVTLVPDGDGQLTSDHGFDFSGDLQRLRACVETYRSLGSRVSLFVDADAAAVALPSSCGVEQAASTGAQRVELYTGPFAAAHGTPALPATLNAFARVAERARAVGLAVNAGHDLSQSNLRDFLDAVPQVDEVSIGHALVCEALYDGLDATVRAYVALVR